MKITRAEGHASTSHIKVIKRYFSSPSLSKTFARVFAAAAANIYVCVCKCSHRYRARDQLLYRYWIITQCETARPRSRVRLHTFHLHTSRSFLSPLLLHPLLLIFLSRLFLRLSLALSLSRPACLLALQRAAYKVAVVRSSLFIHRDPVNGDVERSV